MTPPAGPISYPKGYFLLVQRQFVVYVHTRTDKVGGNVLKGGSSFMRCASCGFPLAPARTSCPRCGAAVAGKAEKRKNAAEAMQASPQGGFSPLEGQAGLENAQPQGNHTSSATWKPDAPAEPLWNNLSQWQSNVSAESPWDHMSSATWTPDGPTDAEPVVVPPGQADNGGYGQQLFNHANTATFAEQLSFPEDEMASDSPLDMAEPDALQPFGLPPDPPLAAAPLPNTPLPNTGWTPDAPSRIGASSKRLNLSSRAAYDSFLASKLTPRFGFTISGAFILTGMLLLIFVFFMSLSLSPASSLTSLQAAPLTPTAMSTQNTPTASQTVAPDPTVSPTADAAAGAQFISNVQTASTVNTTAATAIQVATKFKVHQQIYVTFAIHASQSGMVCLLWFLNGQQFDHYEFPMDGVSTSAYSYTTASAPGSGSIQVYWATKPDCSDKVLAQQASFTVTP